MICWPQKKNIWTRTSVWNVESPADINESNPYVRKEAQT